MVSTGEGSVTMVSTSEGSVTVVMKRALPWSVQVKERYHGQHR